MSRLLDFAAEHWFLAIVLAWIAFLAFAVACGAIVEVAKLLLAPKNPLDAPPPAAYPRNPRTGDEP